MSYTSSTDFLALLRQTSGGVRTERMPGLDYVVAALARAGMINLFVGQTAPVTSQATTAWFQPALQSWAAEGVLNLWNATAGAYQVATPALWAAFLGDSGSGPTPQVIQIITVPGPANVLVNAGIVQVDQTVSNPITLVMPSASAKTGGVLISDWKGDAGANNITIDLSGSDTFPGGLTTWTISNNGGSVFLRPVVGGYVL